MSSCAATIRRHGTSPRRGSIGTLCSKPVERADHVRGKRRMTGDERTLRLRQDDDESPRCEVCCRALIQRDRGEESMPEGNDRIWTVGRINGRTDRGARSGIMHRCKETTSTRTDHRDIAARSLQRAGLGKVLSRCQRGDHDRQPECHAFIAHAVSPTPPRAAPSQRP